MFCSIKARTVLIKHCFSWIMPERCSSSILIKKWFLWILIEDSSIFNLHEEFVISIIIETLQYPFYSLLNSILILSPAFQLSLQIPSFYFLSVTQPIATQFNPLPICCLRCNIGHAGQAATSTFSVVLLITCHLDYGCISNCIFTF